MKTQPLFAFFAALIAACFLVAVVPASNPPAPTPLINGDKPEERPSAKRDQALRSDEHGAKNILLSEKAIPSPNTKAEAKEHDEKALYDFLTGWGTAATAVFTLFMFFTAVAQVALFLWQLRIIREGMIDTKDAAEAAKTQAKTAAIPSLDLSALTFLSSILANWKLLEAIP